LRELCVVVPVHNEQENVKPLAEQLLAAGAALNDWCLRVLFVDDGSSDATYAQLRALHSQGQGVGCIRLSRQSGHQAALEAGLQVAEGDAIITMDGDLQHPPAEIPRMVQAFEDGADVVQMVRRESAEGGKGFFSRLYYRVFNASCGGTIVPNAADFRLLSRRVADVLVAIPERRKFFRGLVPSLGFKQVCLEFDEAERAAGGASYSWRSSLRLARRSLLDFSALPLRLVFWGGLGLALLSFLFGIGHAVYKLVAWHQVAPGFTDLIVAQFFLSGCVLAALGVLGRYLQDVLDHLRGRPVFVIADALACTDDEQDEARA